MKSHGNYYGYPPCCIQAFHTFTKFKEISEERQKATQNGFVPCQVCAERVLKGEIQLHELILPTRECPTPFLKIHKPILQQKK
jgi:hypothetical protein